MKIGLFFGSFNPVHIGHMAIATFFVEFTDIEELWFVVSPHNPLKEKASLLADHHRLEMVELAIGDDPRFRASNIEFRMPRPSYTIDTLTFLREKHPSDEFVLIMGSDSLPTFHKWKNYREIIRFYPRYIYPRQGTGEEEIKKHPGCTVVKAPLIEISSSFIRNALKEKKDMHHFMPSGVYDFISKMNFYQ
jgi:nicotinate-nucleotide adenylyltransferase